MPSSFFHDLIFFIQISLSLMQMLSINLINTMIFFFAKEKSIVYTDFLKKEHFFVHPLVYIL